MSAHNEFNLLKQRRFAPLFWVQFLGAFNDNVFKNALVVLVVFHNLSFHHIDSGVLVNLAAGIFILPYFIFSATSGQIADKFEKSSLIRYVKLLELLIMLIATVSLFSSSVGMMLAVLFLLGTQSTIFGPVKYSILPQQLSLYELTGGNGLIEMGTFVAVLLGTIAGTILIGLPQIGEAIIVSLLLLCSVAGWVMSFFIPLSPANDPNLKISFNIFKQTWLTIDYVRKKKDIFISLLGISWFWLYGSVVLMQLPSYVHSSIGGDTQVYTVFLSLFAVGIGVGSLLCEKLSQQPIELGLVLFGCLGMSIFAIALFLLSPVPQSHLHLTSLHHFLRYFRHWGIMLSLFTMSVFAGFFTVPLYASIQEKSEIQYRSRVIAANNILNAIFMVIAAALAITLLKLHFTISAIILVVAILNLGVGIFMCVYVPVFRIRFVLWLQWLFSS